MGRAPTEEDVFRVLSRLGDPARAEGLSRFFKTGPGEYAEGDRFRGIPVPVLRRTARSFQDLPLEEAEKILASPFHEDRLFALLLLMRIYARSGRAVRRKVYAVYLRNTARINNWDLVDLSAPHIVGAFLAEKDKKPVHRLARSNSLWERRIAIVATFHFIRQGVLDETLHVARILLKDSEDLIQKAVGWMLREVGKRDQKKLESFLAAHARQMPRTMLRYAIEKFPEPKRQAYLLGKVGTQGVHAEHEESCHGADG